jgi:hypothetical protein
MSSLVPVNDTETQWKNHFVAMAKGELPYSDYYIVSINQSGSGEKKEDPVNLMEDKMFGSTHNPSTGRLVDPVSSAANQIKEATSSFVPPYKKVIKPSSKKKPAASSKKQPTKKKAAAAAAVAAASSEEPPKKKRKKKSANKTPPLTFVGPDALGD